MAAAQRPRGKRRRTESPPLECPFAAYVEDVDAMRGWLARHGDIDAMLQQGGGLATISNFLPDAVAQAALRQLQEIPDTAWRCCDEDDTEQVADHGEEGEDRESQRFSTCEPGTSAVIDGLSRTLWVARPQCLPSFSAVRFGPGDHIGCRDDRAQAEVLGADGRPTVFSRTIGAVLYLAKGWKPNFGGDFVDFSAGREQPRRITPTFNTLVLFEVPHKHAISPVLHNGATPLFAVLGWWMAEGELYNLSDSDAESDSDGDREDDELNLRSRSGPAAGTRLAIARAIATKVRDHRSELECASVPRPLPQSFAVDGKMLGSITAKHCATFQRDGLLVVDNVLPLSWARSLQEEVAALERSGSMSQTLQQGYGVRQDKVSYLTAAEAPPSIALAMTYLASIAHALNQRLSLELLVPEAAMVSCFDGNGSHFVAHRDNACEAADDTCTSSPSAATACLNAREVTAIIYGNLDWDETHGGALRCHLGADEADGFGETATDIRDVAPHAGRLVLFKSRELLHEVLPSYGRRVAISLWLLDGRLSLRSGST